jgi:hypothetical protein
MEHFAAFAIEFTLGKPRSVGREKRRPRMRQRLSAIMPADASVAGVGGRPEPSAHNGKSRR